METREAFRLPLSGVTGSYESLSVGVRNLAQIFLKKMKCSKPILKEYI